MSRIVEMISLTRNFAEKHRHNFERVANMSFKRAHKSSEIQLSDELDFYETTLQASQGGEAKLFTSALGIDLPCGHHHSIGPARPPPPLDIGLVVEDMETSLQCDSGFIGDDAPNDHKSHIEDFKRQSAKATNQATPQEKGRR
jgi:hypothetical protein